ncbi:MAG: GNAT family N-acetyltransferase [Bacteroidales bacterium]|nr:GNAT family N-acetyltransferase [Bacteroidales bacterium]
MIRRATTDDIPVIRAMAGVVFRQTYREILSPEQMDYMMDWMYAEESLRRQMLEEGNVFFLDEGRGYASVRRDGQTSDGRERFHLEKLYVMPACQGSGLGRRLFETVADYVRELSSGRPRLELNVNRSNPAVPFYEHLGMHKDRSGDFPIGKGYYMNDYIMAIDL